MSGSHNNNADEEESTYYYDSHPTANDAFHSEQPSRAASSRSEHQSRRHPEPGAWVVNRASSSTGQRLAEGPRVIALRNLSRAGRDDNRSISGSSSQSMVTNRHDGRHLPVPALNTGHTREEVLDDEPVSPISENGRPSQHEENHAQEPPISVDPESERQPPPQEMEKACPHCHLHPSSRPPTPEEPEVVPEPKPLYRQKRWWAAIIVGAILLGVVIALGALLAKALKSNGACEVQVSKNETIPTLSAEVKVNTYQPAEARPIIGSSLSVGEMIFGTSLQPDAEKGQIKAVYEADGERICIRTRSGEIWLDKITCVEGESKKLTPITFTDWIGGPSWAVINPVGYLTSMNYVPRNDTWSRSNLVDEKLTPHPKSKLTSTTWFSGLANWWTFQLPSTQLKEHGMDDFRDRRWRPGTGDLNMAQEGSSIAIGRYMIGQEEYEEIIFQDTNGALKGRRYVDKVWNRQEYNIDGFEAGEIPLGTSMTATTVVNSTGPSVIMLAYIAKSGWLTVRTRVAGNVTDYGAFSAPLRVVQSDGRLSDGIGLSSDGAAGFARIYMFKNQKLLMIELGLDTGTNRTTEILF